jgi:1-acyl-sn-glycerol-3-phosphate acyltransferase
VKGKADFKNLPTPLLIVANHKSFWDVLLVGHLFPLFSGRYFPICTLAQDVFYRNPFVRILFWLGAAYPAHKGQGLEISLAYPRRVLKNNGVFLLFPHGRMVADGNYPIPGRGAATLVKEISNLWILPVYIYSTPNLSLKGFFFSRPKMEIISGAPMQISNAENQSPDDITSALIDQIFALDNTHISSLNKASTDSGVRPNGTRTRSSF